MSRSTSVRNSYNSTLIKSMFKNLANDVTLSQQEQLVFETLSSNLSYNISNIDSQIQSLKAMMLSKISNEFLEQHAHNFHGAITFSGEVTFTGSVQPVFSDQITPFSEINLAQSKSLTGDSKLEMEIGGIESSIVSFHKITNPGQAEGTSSQYGLKFYGAPLYTNGDQTLGTVRRFTITSPFYLNGSSDYVPITANLFDVYIGETNTLLTSGSITNVELNSVPGSPISSNFTVQDIVLSYLDGVYKVYSTTIYM